MPVNNFLYETRTKRNKVMLLLDHATQVKDIFPTVECKSNKYKHAKWVYNQQKQRFYFF